MLVFTAEDTESESNFLSPRVGEELKGFNEGDRRKLDLILNPLLSKLQVVWRRVATTVARFILYEVCMDVEVAFFWSRVQPLIGYHIHQGLILGIGSSQAKAYLTLLPK